MTLTSYELFLSYNLQKILPKKGNSNFDTQNQHLQSLKTKFKVIGHFTSLAPKGQQLHCVHVGSKFIFLKKYILYIGSNREYQKLKTGSLVRF